MIAAAMMCINLEKRKAFFWPKSTGIECKLNCGHAYHYECIKEWAYDRGNNNCPQCRGSIIDIIV